MIKLAQKAATMVSNRNSDEDNHCWSVKKSYVMRQSFKQTMTNTVPIYSKKNQYKKDSYNLGASINWYNGPNNHLSGH